MLFYRIKLCFFHDSQWEVDLFLPPVIFLETAVFGTFRFAYN